VNPIEGNVQHVSLDWKNTVIFSESVQKSS